MPQRVRGLLCIVCGNSCWGLSGACVQCLTSQYGMNVLTLTSIRMLAAGAILLLFLQMRGNPVRLSHLRENHLLGRMAIFGIVGVFASQLTYCMTIAYTNAGTATVLCCLNAVMLLGVVCIAKRRLPHAVETIAVILALVSVWLIATGGDPANLVGSPTGILWGIASAVAITFYTLYAKPLMHQVGSIPTVGLGMLFGGMASTVIAAPQWSFPALDAMGWIILLCVILLGTVVTFGLYFQGVLDLEPVEVGVLTVIEPAVATFLSAVWLGTPFGTLDYVAFTLMFIMVIMVSVTGSKEPAEDTT